MNVLIPIYNCANLVFQICENISLQAHKPKRVIILDDGSTDNTWEVLQYAIKCFNTEHTSFVPLRNKINCGRGYSRNKLLHVADCGYICWFDADDLWNIDKTHIQKWFYEKNVDKNNASKTILYSDYRMCHSDDIWKFRDTDMPQSITLDDLTCIHNELRNIQLQTTFGQRDAFLLGGGFSEDMKWSEDLDFAFRHLTNGGSFKKTLSDVKPLVWYFHSLRGKNFREIEDAHSAFFEKWQHVFEEKGVNTDQYRAHKRLRYNIHGYITNKEIDEAKKIIFDCYHYRKNYEVRKLLKSRILLLKSKKDKGIHENPILMKCEELILRNLEKDNSSRRIKASYLANRNLLIRLEVPQQKLKKVIVEWLNSDKNILKQEAYSDNREIEIVFSEIISNFLSGISCLRIKGVTEFGTIMRSLTFNRTSEGNIALF